MLNGKERGPRTEPQEAPAFKGWNRHPQGNKNQRAGTQGSEEGVFWVKPGDASMGERQAMLRALRDTFNQGLKYAHGIFVRH